MRWTGSIGVVLTLCILLTGYTSVQLRRSDELFDIDYEGNIELEGNDLYPYTEEVADTGQFTIDLNARFASITNTNSCTMRLELRRISTGSLDPLFVDSSIMEGVQLREVLDLTVR